MLCILKPFARTNTIEFLFRFSSIVFITYFLLDCIPSILKFLNNDNMEMREVASLAIANLTNSNHNNCQIVMDKNATDLLIKLLSDKNHEVQTNIATCISNLAANGNDF